MNKKQNVLKYLLLIELKGVYKQCSIKASQIFRKKIRKRIIRIIVRLKYAIINFEIHYIMKR